MSGGHFPPAMTYVRWVSECNQVYYNGAVREAANKSLCPRRLSAETFLLTAMCRLVSLVDAHYICLSVSEPLRAKPNGHYRPVHPC